VAQVSKRKLNPEIWERVFNLFLESFGGIKNKKEFAVFIEDILSPTEKIMLAKRFAIAILIAKGNSYDSITDILKVTPSTVSRVTILLRYGKGLNKSIEKALKKDKIRVLWKEIQDLIDTPTKGNLREYALRGKRRRQEIQRIKKGIG
jgi:uncharacterized protein YerC